MNTQPKGLGDALPELGAPTIDDVVREIAKGGFLKEYLGMSPHGTLLLDGHGSIRYFNPRQAEYFGFSELETASRQLINQVLFKGARFFADEQVHLDEQKYGVLKTILDKKVKEARSSQVEVVRGEDRRFYNMFFQRYHGGVRVDMVDVTEEMIKATTDPLTGAFNRAYLDHVFLPELERRGEAYNKKMVIDYSVGAVYIDLKKFKVINDTKGHDAGDKMLIDVANLLRANFKSSDSIVRLGGDEFLVMCEDVDDKELERLNSRLLEAQAIYNSKVKDPVLRMNMDIGVISGKGLYKDLIKIAEAYMRENKRETS